MARRCARWLVEQGIPEGVNVDDIRKNLVHFMCVRCHRATFLLLWEIFHRKSCAHENCDGEIKAANEVND